MFSALSKCFAVAVLWGSICSATETDLRADIELVLAEEGLTGIAWTMVAESGEVSLGAAGLQDNQAQSSFTTDTRFHVGSLTKSLLATGILRLATEGRIEIDAPVSRYLPSLSIDNQWAGIASVTVRHLLDHTSGLSDAQMWQVFSERPDSGTPLIAAFPEPEKQLQIRSRPGSRFSYSNIGYTLLGMIIESVVEGRYEGYLDEHVLTSLAMYDSTFAYTTQEGENSVPLLAWGHVDDGSRYAASPMFLRPAGQFTTTAADLSRFAQFLLSDGNIDDHPFIDEALMRTRGNASGTEAANAGLVAGYALGLGRRDRHGVVGYCHAGNTVGFVAMLCVFPAEQKAFSYSVNTDSETADYGRLNSLFVGALGVARALPPQSVDAAPDIADWHGRYVLNPNRFPTFQYLDDVFGAIRISADGESLKLTSLQQDVRHLRPVGDRIYSANDRETASHVFLRGIEGEYLISDGFRTYEKVSSTYLFAHWTSVALGLVGVTWLFLAGIVSLVRFRSTMMWRPVGPAFAALALLFVPIPFFMSQSFMALGDVTFASVLLGGVSALLPFGMLLTVIRAMKTWRTIGLSMFHGVAALLTLQWCVVLIAAGLLPLTILTL